MEAKTRELPKYTQYELSSLVNKKIKELGISVAEISSSLGLDINIINEVVEGEIIFKMPHYELVATLLGKDVEELLSDLEYESSCYFRADETNQDIEMFVSKMDYLFTEWVYQKKIAGVIE